mgnify:CR=1 FL=1
MQQSDNFNDIDELLENWDKLRNTHLPSKLETLNEAIVREYAKNIIDHYAYEIRVSRLKNNTHDENHFIDKFSESYEKYLSDLTYRILKNGN